RRRATSSGHCAPAAPSSCAPCFAPTTSISCARPRSAAWVSRCSRCPWRRKSCSAGASAWSCPPWSVRRPESTRSTCRAAARRPSSRRSSRSRPSSPTASPSSSRSPIQPLNDFDFHFQLDYKGWPDEANQGHSAEGCMWSRKSSALLGAVVLSVGCTGDGDALCEIEPGATWDAAGFDQSAAEALALRGRLDAFSADRMRDAETGDATVDVDALVGLYEAGDPSIKSLTTTAWQPIVDDAFEEFVAVIDAGVQDLVNDDGEWDPGATGGIFEVDSRGINAGGIEVRQIVDKGLFG